MGNSPLLTMPLLNTTPWETGNPGGSGGGNGGPNYDPSKPTNPNSLFNGLVIKFLATKSVAPNCIDCYYIGGNMAGLTSICGYNANDKKSQGYGKIELEAYGMLSDQSIGKITSDASYVIAGHKLPAYSNTFLYSTKTPSTTYKDLFLIGNDYNWKLPSLEKLVNSPYNWSDGALLGNTQPYIARNPPRFDKYFYAPIRYYCSLVEPNSPLLLNSIYYLLYEPRLMDFAQSSGILAFNDSYISPLWNPMYANNNCLVWNLDWDLFYLKNFLSKRTNRRWQNFMRSTGGSTTYSRSTSDFQSMFQYIRAANSWADGWMWFPTSSGNNGSQTPWTWYPNIARYRNMVYGLSDIGTNPNWDGQGGDGYRVWPGQEICSAALEKKIALPAIIWMMINSFQVDWDRLDSLVLNMQGVYQYDETNDAYRAPTWLGGNFGTEW